MQVYFGVFVVFYLAVCDT